MLKRRKLADRNVEDTTVEAVCSQFTRVHELISSRFPEWTDEQKHELSLRTLEIIHHEGRDEHRHSLQVARLNLQFAHWLIPTILALAALLRR